MPDVREPGIEPAWVERMRRRGYVVRTGVGDLPPVPEFSFTPPPDVRRRGLGRSLKTIVRRLFTHRFTRILHGRHAPVP